MGSDRPAKRPVKKKAVRGEVRKVMGARSSGHVGQSEDLEPMFVTSQPLEGPDQRREAFLTWAHTRSLWLLS